MMTLLRSGLCVLLVACLLVAPRAQACAMIAAHSGDAFYFGSNEDYIEPGYYWVKPAAKGRLGRVAFGFKDQFMQGGMNEMGLCFDAAVVTTIPWELDPKKETPKNLLDKIMDECGTVAEALSYFEQYNCKHLASAQFMFADATGAAVVVTGDPRGHLSVMPRNAPVLMNTNVRLEFSQYRCPRYVLAEQTLQKAPSLGLAAVAEALGAIHQEGKDAYTTYTYIAEPLRGVIHVYQHGNMAESITLDVKSLLAEGKQKVALGPLFKQGPTLEEIRAAKPRTYQTAIALSPAAVKRFCGTYHVAEPATDVFVRPGEGSQLTMVVGDQDPLTLAPESPNKFRILPDAGQVTFQSDPNGKLMGFMLHRNGDHFVPRTGDNP
jgi:hypothetical protein